MCAIEVVEQFSSVMSEPSTLLPFLLILTVMLIFHGMSDVPANKLITAKATSIMFDWEKYSFLLRD